METNIEIKDCKIEGNKELEGHADQATSGLVLMWSTCVSQRNEYRNQKAITGTFLIAASGSDFVDENSTFYNGEADQGGLGYVVGSKASLLGSFIDNMTANTGGLFYTELSAIITLNDTIVTNSASTNPPSILFISNTKLTINKCLFTGYQGNGILIQNTNHLISIENSNFTNGVEREETLGGAFALSDVEKFRVSGCRFENLQAKQGGALFLTSDLSLSYSYEIFNNTFSNCSAYQGGAIYNENIQLILYDNLFLNNTASNPGSSRSLITVYGQGGAIYTDLVTALKYISLASNFTNNVFSGNRADQEGGSVKWIGLEPENLAKSNIFDDNNDALYGKNIASEAVSLKIVEQITGRILSDNETQIQNVASGQNVPITLCIGLFDIYETLVSTENSATWQLLPADNTTTISGQTRVNAQSGIFCYDEFKIIADPGTNVQILAVSSIFENSPTEGSTLNIEVALRSCIIGESLINRECYVCGPGTYSLDPMSESCEECPEGAFWFGNHTMTPRKGFWRASNSTDSFFACPFANACLGGDDIENGKIWDQGQCEEGYEGNKCQAWSDGYSRVGKNEWYTCPSQMENIVIWTMAILLMMMAVTLMVKSTLASANKPKAIHSVYMRIFVNYLQVIMLMISFDLSWPTIVYEFLAYQETAGSVTGQIYSMDCLSQDASDLHPYYAKSLLVCVLPIIVILLSVSFWGIAAIVQRRPDYLRKQLVSTIIIVLFLIHPMVVKSIFAQFAWTEIEQDEWWLIEQMDIRCWDEEHTQYVIRIFIPALIIWGFGIPAISLLLLVKNKKYLETEDVRLKYGFLFLGYSIHSFYWEFVIMSRKIMIAFISVFFASISASVQGLLAFFLLMISLLLQILRQPYTHPSLNKLETFAIMTASTTIYCGLFYLSESIDEITGIFFFIIILLTNFIFIFYWCKSMFSNMVLKLMGLVMLRRVQVKNDSFDSYDQTIPGVSQDLDGTIKDNMTFMEVKGRPPSAISSIK